METIVDSRAYSVAQLFADTYTVDFYQREYVWEYKQMEDLIVDLTNSFLRNYRITDKTKDVQNYSPYFMGEIVISTKDESKKSIIDGQQRITSITLLLIYLIKKYGNVASMPTSIINGLIYVDDYGDYKFNLDIPERKECMESLYKKGDYVLPVNPNPSVVNLLERYSQIETCWPEEINDNNVALFAYWLINKVKFSKVWTNSDDFAYVIFETMNDRGLSLTQVEMLRSYLLANISSEKREESLDKFDKVISELEKIKLPSKSKAKFEFFKNYFRSQFASGSSQSKDTNSDFARIGKEFHRWIREKSVSIGLIDENDFVAFINRIEYYAKLYIKINSIIESRNTADYLYLIVNSDYGFTLQTQLILASVNYLDDEQIIQKKIQLVSKYITKVLTWRVWNHWVISQSSLDGPIFELCKNIRNKSVDELDSILSADPITPKPDGLKESPTLNKQNRPKIRVLLSLITEIVSRSSGITDYMLNKKDIEIEHIWSDHYEQHTEDCSTETEFNIIRNNIGDLLVLPKQFNASYGDLPYQEKVEPYFGQNVLAQTLNIKKYQNNPGFIKYKSDKNLNFKHYEIFNKNSISERAELYKEILIKEFE